MKLNDALRFSFSGYSIWLDPEQYNSDLDKAIKVASKELGVYPIPAPHVTLGKCCRELLILCLVFMQKGMDFAHIYNFRCHPFFLQFMELKACPKWKQ